MVSQDQNGLPMSSTPSSASSASISAELKAFNDSYAVVRYTPEGKLVFANERFLHLTGCTLDELVGMEDEFLVSLIAQNVLSPRFWARLEKSEPQRQTVSWFDKGGRELWFQSRYLPLRDEAGRVFEVLRIVDDVTERLAREADERGQVAAISRAYAVVHFSLEGQILDVNEHFLAATGYSWVEMIGRHHALLVDERDRYSDTYIQFWKALGRGEYRSGEYRRIGKGGREVWLQASYNPIFDTSGKPFKIVKYAVDITQDKLAQVDLRGRIEAINKSQAVAVFNLDGTIAEANPRFLSIFGYTQSEVLNRHHSMLMERSEAEGGEYEAFWRRLRVGEYQSGLFRRLGRDGREIWLQASYNPTLDLNGEPVKIVKYATDVSSNVAMAEAFEDARRQAQHDPATSLPNRLKLSAFLDRCLASSDPNLVLLYLDLDRFKPINEIFGHHVGDLALGEVADRVRRSIDPDHMVARIGGDEFVIACPGLPTREIDAYCKKLIETVSMPFVWEGLPIAVGLSIGIALAPTDGKTTDDLLRAADAALYKSKKNGGGQFSFYSVKMNDRLVSQQKLAEDMRSGLPAQAFFLEYQPRFDTRSRTVRSVEALVRWNHAELGRIAPGNFITLAERNGFIIPLGEWILETACRTAVSWDGVGVSVNVSPVQFRDPSLVSKVRQVLEQTGLPPELLELEITEGVLLEDSDRAMVVLGELKKLGVQLAMDDFGTGYSSLSYLRHFPFDVIKIDRSFITDLDATGSARSIVQAILNLGRALGLKVAAEGVETNEQLLILTADRCEEIQGFLLAPPLAAATIDELLCAMPELRRNTDNQSAAG